MTWLDLQPQLFGAGLRVVEFACHWFLQSTLLIAVGLALGWMLQKHGSAVQSIVYRTSLAAALLCPLGTWFLALGGASGEALARFSVKFPKASDVV